MVSVASSTESSSNAHDHTIATLFSGGEGFGIGAQAAGYRHLWGKELDPRIAGVAQANGFHTLVADVRIDDYDTLPRPYHLHASPVCKNASVAKHDGVESPIDIETAQAVCRAIIVLRPTVFTLENVRGYLRFEAFALIVAILRAEGYGVTYDGLNSADYGVPQTRERLILRAVRGQDRPQLPTPTHARADLITPMFDSRLPWIGWYEAIADLLAVLPDSKFAAWQQKRLDAADMRKAWAFLMNKSQDKFGDGLRFNDEPSHTVQASSHGTRAFQGRVVRMTPRALARFQSFPNWYQLPIRKKPRRLNPREQAWLDQSAFTEADQRWVDEWLVCDDALACMVIGNAVPPLLAQRICEVR